MPVRTAPWLGDGHLHKVKGDLWDLFLLVVTVVPDQSSPFMTSFNLNHLKATVSNTVKWGLGLQYTDFGGTQLSSCSTLLFSFRDGGICGEVASVILTLELVSLCLHPSG